ncbi:hypothetical protein [Pseudorhodoplanes sinuspersici]|nr:hypothetical protein [Pseudorhodoplanes sinuspersici]RKE73094.1 hypothetical protein DFP91_0973 [Pseudorhodoplanes sinuspersici]
MTDKDKRPTREELQPDPQLKLSSGRANWVQMTLVAAACALILGLTIYGLNQPERDVASTPGTETTGAAPQQEQTGGNTAGGKNVDQTPPAAQQPNQPAQQPAPEQTKPATPDDSKR